MNNVVKLSNKRDWKWHRDRIASAWGKQVPSIIETGQALIDAKEELAHGSFEAMIRKELPFKRATAYKVRAIAANPIISNVSHVKHLPASWGTLHELARLPDDILLAKLKDGSIHPKMERKDVLAMRPAKDKPKAPARKDDAPPTTIEPQAQRDEMRCSYVTFLQTLTKEEQIEELRKIVMRELGWTTKELSVFLPSHRIKFR